MRRYVAMFALVGLLAALAAGQPALAQGSSRTILVVPQPYYGGYGYPYYRAYRPYYPAAHGYYLYHPAPYSYYQGPYVYPPIYVPPETLYGPRALRRFMGWGW